VRDRAIVEAPVAKNKKWA